MKEVPLNSKLYFVATTSEIRPKAFDLLSKYYGAKPNIVRLMGDIYSLDWKEMIHFGVWFSEENKIKITCVRLINENGIVPFFGSLLLDCCGEKGYEAIINLHYCPTKIGLKNAVTLYC